ncbi:unnamed protein product [Boreogadus saida]
MRPGYLNQNAVCPSPAIRLRPKLYRLRGTSGPGSSSQYQTVMMLHFKRLALTPTTIPPSSHNRLEKDQPSARPRDDVLMSGRVCEIRHIISPHSAVEPLSANGFAGARIG